MQLASRLATAVRRCSATLCCRRATPYRLLSTAPLASPTASPAASSFTTGPSSRSVDPDEIRRFNQMADEWWSLTGSSGQLHVMNPYRVRYIAKQVQQHFQTTRRVTASEPLKGLDVLDVGCGGGLLSESLARLGGNVHGIDAASQSIHVAKEHAKLDPLFADGRLLYSCVTAESLLAAPKLYDVVCALEIVEHVTHPPSFINTIAALVKPGGLLIMSTINKTYKAYVLTIIGAEYVLNWIPRGTHDWNKYISPESLSSLIVSACHPSESGFRAYEDKMQPHTPTLPLEAMNQHGPAAGASPSSSSASNSSIRTLGFRMKNVSGMTYNPIFGTWKTDSGDTDVNYILTAEREG